MAILKIPIDSVQPDHKFQMELEGVIYTFRFKLNYRENRWTMDISDELGVLIVGGVAIVTNFPLLKQYKNRALPPGNMICLDLSDSGAEPIGDVFGNTHLLIYEESGG